MNNTIKARVLLMTEKAVRGVNKLTRSIQRTDRVVNTLNTQLHGLPHQMDRFGNRGVKAGNDVTKSLRNARHELMEINGALSRVNGLYTVLSGARTLITSSDSVTSAKNKLNYINSGVLGEDGYTTDSYGNTTYSAATLNMTQEQLDKMYTSSQKVRADYLGLMSNVSKSMTLAPDAFDNNMDNAIRFQEIMAESYVLGGASAQEMHSSMYQMIQALGAGVLAGDELRSVREGAPLAYQAIEEYAQGVYNTEMSLKDMASQGMITSDIVVAAMMNMGDSIDKAFEQTNMTYAQAWTMIKNSATRAFAPVFEKLEEFLNSEKGTAAIEMFCDAMLDLAWVVSVIITIVTTLIGIIADNWSWLKYIIYSFIAALGLVVLAMGAMTAASIAAAIAARLPFLTTILWAALAVGAIIAYVSLFYDASKSLAENISNMAFALCAVILVILAIILVASTIVNISITMGVWLVVLFVIAVLALLVGIFVKWADKILGVFFGAIYAMEAILQNLKIAWNNLCVEMQRSFWLWIDDVISNMGVILDIVNAIREAMGKDALEADFALEKANALEEEVQEYINVGDAWAEGKAYGEALGVGIQDKINSWGEAITGKYEEFQDALNTSTVGEDLGNMNDTLNGIGDDTSSIADSMALTAEDLEYLRKVAAMEWKKEFTTANITVDMTNYNQVDGSNDLDGLVTTLSKKLYEELGEVANGVYV